MHKAKTANTLSTTTKKHIEYGGLMPQINV